jgi:hypothetical protein
MTNFPKTLGLASVDADYLDAVMEDLMQYRRMKYRGQVAGIAEHLKVCPLCGAVNQVKSSKCFVCSWHGEFETNSTTVEQSLDELILKCPQLLEALLPEPKPKKLLLKAIEWFHTRIARFKRINLAA